MKRVRGWLLAAAVLCLSACGYNAIQRQDEAVKAQWSEVLNQYQRRADLVPNLVRTVRGYAAHEDKVLTEVTAARARLGAIRPPTEGAADPQQLARFQQAQGTLSGALSRLMVVSEHYPQLKADGLFQNLQAQLEGSENRITVARHRYVEAVRAYNVLVRRFPVNLTARVFGYAPRAHFSVDNAQAIATAPRVDFEADPAPAGSVP